MNVFLIITIPMIIVTLTGCSGSYNLPGVDMIISKVQSVTNAELSDDILAEVVESNNQFAFDMYKQLVSGSESNLVFSPLSISQTWAMVWEGAVGETADEIAETLHFAGHEPEDVHKAFNRINHSLRQIDRQKDVTLNVDNSIWVDKNEDYVQEYLDAIKRWYNSGLHGVDFGDPDITLNAMKRWLNNKTGGQLLEAIDRDLFDNLTVMVLLGTVYFDGRWDIPFDSDETEPRAFHLLDGTRKSAPTMYNSEMECSWLKVDEYLAVELQYKGESASMLIVMPSEGTFEDFETKMTPDLFHDISDSFKKSEIPMYMPKFTIKTINRLKENFRAIGIDKALMPGAVFTKMVPGGGIWVGEFIHGAYIDVSEVQTIAVALSAGFMPEPGLVESLYVVRIDHPFIFFIRDNETGTILFMGRVVDPSI